MNVCAISPTYGSQHGTSANPSILCVDDSEEILLICQTVLESDGYQVFTAGSGAAALELLNDTSDRRSCHRQCDARNERQLPWRKKSSECLQTFP